MESFLTTERMVLRKFTEADAEHLIELDSDPAVMLYITGGELTPAAEIVNEVLPHFATYDASGFGFYAAEDRASGEFLGWFHFRRTDDAPAGEIELGYRLRRDVWGRGLASEGSRALVDKGFAELDVQRVTAYAVAVNTASRRVMEKAGLRYVRTFHDGGWPWKIPGDEAGDVEYALTREEWLSDRSG